jgi:hypothetical protein
MLTALIVTAIAAPRSPDEKDGWKEAKWGGAPLPDMVCKTMKPTDTECRRPVESGDRQIGGVTASMVHYSYWRGRLTSVLMTVPPSEATAVLDGLVQVYGPPLRGSAGQSAWMGETVAIMYAHRPDGPSLMYVSLTLANERAAVEAAEAAGDL